MPEASSLPLHEWETFYVILGSSAAALTGLMFVVVALSAERRLIPQDGNTSTLDSFATPTVVHFCIAILIAALASTPEMTPRVLGIALLATGVVGLIYSAVVLARVRRQKGYAPVFEDWLWHVILPPIAYLSLSLTALAMQRRPHDSLYAVGAVELLLLFIGIHNAWDSAVFIATREAKRD